MTNDNAEHASNFFWWCCFAFGAIQTPIILMVLFLSGDSRPAGPFLRSDSLKCVVVSFLFAAVLHTWTLKWARREVASPDYCEVYVYAYMAGSFLGSIAVVAMVHVLLGRIEPVAVIVGCGLYDAVALGATKAYLFHIPKAEQDRRCAAARERVLTYYAKEALNVCDEFPEQDLRALIQTRMSNSLGCVTVERTAKEIEDRITRIRERGIMRWLYERTYQTPVLHVALNQDQFEFFLANCMGDDRTAEEVLRAGDALHTVMHDYAEKHPVAKQCESVPSTDDRTKALETEIQEIRNSGREPHVIEAEIEFLKRHYSK